MNIAVQDHANVRIHIVPVLSDNYTYLVEWETGCAIVDPGESGPVEHLLGQLGKPLQHIIITHHHYDHVGGVPDLLAAWHCAVSGPANAVNGPNAQPLQEGDPLQAGPLSFKVLSTPGHTASDTSYYAESDGLVFTGDTLFAGGCGRLFECTAGEMWNSLMKIRDLPPETRVYCGHEYTRDNLAFARAQWPDHAGIAARDEAVQALREADRPTVPSTLEEERATNIFLLADQSELKQRLGMEGAGDADVFAELRRRKDRF